MDAAAEPRGALMRIWTFERHRFEEEYARRRAEWAGDLPADNRQADLFAA